MLIDVNTLVKKKIKHKTFYIKRYKINKFLVNNITVK